MRKKRPKPAPPRQQPPNDKNGGIKTHTAFVIACIAFGFGMFAGMAITANKPTVIRATTPGAIQAPVDPRITQLEDEVARNPENVGAWITLGNRYFDGGQHARAIDAYEKSLALAPGNANVLTDLGIMYRRNGDPRKAVEAFDRAIAADPKHENARFNKGVVLMHDLNDIRGAITAWESLWEINPLAMAPNGQSVDQLIQQTKKQLSQP